MKTRKLMIIINPKAGVNAHRNLHSSIIESAEELMYIDRDGVRKAYDVDVRFTTHAGHATELAALAAGSGYYGVIACGGDGTVNEVARGVRDTRTVLGIIPLGSGNGLARHLGIPLTVKGAFKVIAEDRVLDADYASANSRPFFCTFGVGFDAEVTEKFNSRPGRGLKNYIITTLEEYSRYHPDTYTIIANGTRITEKALIIAVCNASQYGNNAYIAPQASIKDGMLDVTVVHNGSVLENAMAAIGMLSGMIGHSEFATTTFRAQTLKIIRNHEGAVHFDGEPANLSKIIEIKCYPGKLRLFSTSMKSRLRPLMAPEIPFLSPMALTFRDLSYKIQNIIRKIEN